MVLVGASVAVLAALALLASRPAMPVSWRQLHVGMTQREAERLFGPDGEAQCMGCWERFECPAPMLGADSRWRLLVDYDEPANSGGARLVRATARFVHPLALLNSKPRTLVGINAPTNGSSQ